MNNTDTWSPWNTEGCLTDLPSNSQVAALGAAIGKTDYEALGQAVMDRFPKTLAALAESERRLPDLPDEAYPDESILLPAGIMPIVYPRSAANDNKPPMIGITGKRNVGKSTVATLLESKFGFSRAHAFDGGKLAAETYFRHVTGSALEAQQMVYGYLKDIPSPHLPGNVAPRFFLEKFGHFMGVDMGVEWTLAMEINRLRRESPKSPIVVESLVYEAPWFQAAGGYVLRLERPDHDGPEGIASDSVQATIKADAVISARSVEELEDKALRLIDSLVGEQEVRRWSA